MSVIFFIYLIIKSFNFNLYFENYKYINIIYNYYLNKLILNKNLFKYKFYYNYYFLSILLLLIINNDILMSGDNNNFYKINAQEPVTPIAYGIIKLHDHI